MTTWTVSNPHASMFLSWKKRGLIYLDLRNLDPQVPKIISKNRKSPAYSILPILTITILQPTSRRCWHYGANSFGMAKKNQSEKSSEGHGIVLCDLSIQDRVTPLSHQLVLPPSTQQTLRTWKSAGLSWPQIDWCTPRDVFSLFDIQIPVFAASKWPG